MSNVILETKNLSKRYKTQIALNRVNLRIEQGHIYGLIGKNGAGKTTLMRMITGLGFPTDGTIALFGKNNRKELGVEQNRIGSLIEYPGLVNGMTAKENIHLHCLIKGIPNYEVEEELLELVGLSDTGRKKVKNFSLGMKQRLGIAIVLLGNPSLLLLDEPINGLDPSGIMEVRSLLMKLREFENKTILISSHNLPELYQVATDYIIIHNGEIRETISHAELEERCKSYIALESTDVNLLAAVLERKLGTDHFKVMPDNSIRLYDLLDQRERIGQTLFDNKVVVTRLAMENASLEEYFMNVIGGEDHA